MIDILYDGTNCDYCGNSVYKALGLDYRVGDNVFCCKECADDYEQSNQ